MFKKIIYLFVMITLSCGRKEKADQDEFTKSQVLEKVKQIESKVLSCNVNGIEHPGRPDCNLDDYPSGPGGFGCLAGDQQACYTMSLILDSSGKPYRSYKNKIENDNKNEFSRDQLYGVVAYLIATKDTKFAQKLMSYIETNRKLCDNADDNRCELTPSVWGLLNKTWKYLGLKPTDSMVANNAVDDLFIYTQAQTVETGYQLNLQMQFVFLSQEMGLSNNLLNQAAKVGFNRQSANPFYCYVYEGSSTRCMHLYLNWFKYETPGGDMHQWSIARDQNEEEAKMNSMGWDALFLGRLLLR